MNRKAQRRRTRPPHSHGYPPLPGLARLRRKQGDDGAAKQLLLDALATNPLWLHRAKLLPELIDTGIELEHLDDARAYLEELEEVSDLCTTRIGGHRDRGWIRPVALFLVQGVVKT